MSSKVRIVVRTNSSDALADMDEWCITHSTEYSAWNYVPASIDYYTFRVPFDLEVQFRLTWSEYIV